MSRPRSAFLADWAARVPLAVVLLWMLVLCVVLLLSGCASVPASACPPLKSYSLIEQQALADELQTDGHEAQSWVRDYLALRESCRAQR
jgi:uncharacterized protein YceK